jgi:hypothetical protein
MSRYHHYEIRASYGPEQLFAALRATCEAAGADFEFNWIGRAIHLLAADLDTAESTAATLVERVAIESARGMLLPGDAQQQEDGRIRLPIGILLQTPDVFVDVITGTLHEFGIAGIRRREDGNGFFVPISKSSRALNYHELVMGFPLPAYLRIEDMGQR